MCEWRNIMAKKIAIITARSGSKRIPKKNVKLFCGKPIIQYSIEVALESGLFSEVMVSTDSEEIAQVARKYGASVPFLRSEATSSDFASTEDVILEVINDYKKMGKEFDYVCCIYPTAPFIDSDILNEAMCVMETRKPSVVIPMVQYSYPPQRCFIIDENGDAKFKFPEYVATRSQDLEKQYHDVGQFYVYNVKKLIDKKGIIVDDIAPVVISELKAQDIDTVEDWEIAEMKYKMLSMMKKEKEDGLL